MKVVLVSLVLSVLAVDFVSTQLNSTDIPLWAQRQLRRSRRRQNIPNCNAFSYNRCLHGNCLLATKNQGSYPDTAESFTNTKAKTEFYCMCTSGYETYYPNEQNKKMPPDNQNSPFCNAEEDPCRKNPQLCITKSSLSKCIHTGPNDFKCQCTPFWQGTLCNQDVDECYPCDHSDGGACPCKNSATCSNAEESNANPLGFTCQCESGTSGQFCEKITDPCARKPCVSKANFGGAVDDATQGCTPLAQSQLDLSDPTTLFGYECKCENHWGGQNCEMRKGNCGTDPCDGKGLCVDDLNYPGYYKCVCSEGYQNVVADLNKGAEGKFCTKQTDMCSPYNPCFNGGTCLTIGPNLVECVCEPGYVGPYCGGIKNPCYDSNKKKCLNGGKCKPVLNSGVGFTCDCSGTGFDGKVCENNIDECMTTPNLCNGNGKCIDTVGSFECKCNKGYINTPEDKTCNTVESLCDLETNICQYQGKCTKTDNINMNFECDCQFVKIQSLQAMIAGRGSGICDAAKPGRSIQLGAKLDVDVNTIKDSDSVVKTIAGGVLNNPFWWFHYGSAKLTAPKTPILPGNMILYFRTSQPNEGNLLTVWEPGSGAEKGKKVLEIVPSSNRKNYIVKFHLNPPVDIVLPRHSFKGWNTIMISATRGKVSVFLNTALIESKDVTSLPTIGLPSAIYIGTDLDSDGAETGPKFSGGIGDLFYFEKQPDNLEYLKKNILLLNNPDCKPYLNLEFKQPNNYRDSGCLMLDVTPVLEEMRSKLVKTPNGEFPLVYFQSHIDLPFMKKYLNPLQAAHMSVPSFPTLFNDDDFGYGMLFRFRPNFDGLKEEKDPLKVFKVFARSKFVNGKDDDTYAIRVGTTVDGKKFMFRICFKTNLEYKCADSLLDTDITADDFCRECIWAVAVSWKKIIDKDGSTDDKNLEIANWRGEIIKKTNYSLKGKLSRASMSALEIGVDRAHEVGPMRIQAGSSFIPQESENWLKNVNF